MMRFRFFRLGSLVVAGVCLALSASAQWATQTLVLEPGWNAVHFEVEPYPNDCDTVFQGIPVESVWAWNGQFSSVEYIQDANTLVPEQPGWLGYFPPSSALAFRTGLFTLQGNRAYLAKLTGAEPVSLTVTGRPVPPDGDWVSDSFNLKGFHVDTAAPPTFATYFAASAAHLGQPVCRLNSAGEWERIPDPSTEVVREGEAYWVYCQGYSKVCRASDR